MLRIAIIGCGGMGQFYAGLLRGFAAEAMVTAVADPNADAAAACAALCPAPAVFDDAAKAAGSPDVDAVLVCSPTGLHREHVVAAAAAGKHVFCDKPMAVTTADADAMIDACSAAKVGLAVGLMRRFDNEWLAMSELVRAGVVGRPAIWRHLHGSPGPMKAWPFDPKMGGGPFVDAAINHFDFAMGMFGRPVSASASLSIWNPTHAAADTGSCTVMFENGDRLSLCYSWGLAPGVRWETDNDVVGPAGMLVTAGPNDPMPPGFNPEQQGAVKIAGGGGRVRTAAYAKNNMFQDQMRNWIDSVTQGKPVRVTGEVARDALAIAEAVLKSARDGMSVAVDTRFLGSPMDFSH